MAAQKAKIIPGTSYEDLIDTFEAETIAYMSNKRGISELAMRNLLLTDKATNESYNRKVARLVFAADRAGFTFAAFKAATLKHRNQFWSQSGNAGPMQPGAGSFTI
jgi:hypothetical protein